jgi:hypothetical protein
VFAARGNGCTCQVHYLAGADRLAPRGVLVPISGLSFGLRTVLRLHVSQLFCQVTAIVNAPEQKGARVEACALPFRAGRERPRPAGYLPADRMHRTE